MESTEPILKQQPRQHQTLIKAFKSRIQHFFAIPQKQINWFKPVLWIRIWLHLDLYSFGCPGSGSGFVLGMQFRIQEHGY